MDMQHVSRVRTTHRGRTIARWAESIAGDVRFALRHFARKPLLTAAAVLVLSIGIGVHAAAFSLIQAVTMRPAPGVPRDDALVAIRGKQRLDREARWRPRALSYPELRELAARRDVFASVAGWSRNTVAFAVGDGERGWAEAQFVTSGYFPTIGVQPIVGVGLPLEGSDENEPRLVAVITHALWRSTFGSSPAVVGRIIRVNDVAVRIVGVAPPRFNGAVPAGGDRTLWMPLSARAVINGTTPLSLARRDSAMLELVGRLRDGASLEQANTVVHLIDARSTQSEISVPGLTRAADVVALRGNVNVSGEREVALMAASYEAMALLILLITCANVSALAVGAAATRRHEIAIRLALGASRARLIRQLLTESTLLALGGGALGLMLYWWLAKLLAAELPREDIAPDLVTALFTMCLALGTGILFGLSPALHATRHGAGGALKDSSNASTTGRSRLQRVFVVAQIALTQPLLVGLGVMMVILSRNDLRQPNAGIAERVVRIAFNSADQVRVSSKEEMEILLRAAREGNARADAAMERVAGLPGVVGVVRTSPGYEDSRLMVAPEDRSGLPESSAPVNVRMENSGPGYFALLGIPIVGGRDLVATDSSARDIPLVIGSDLARSLWGGASAIGKRFDRESDGREGRQRFVVVGIYDAERETTDGAQPAVYAPLHAGPMSFYLLRTVDPAAPIIPAVRSTILSEIPRASVQLETMADRQAAERAGALKASGAAGTGGLLALLLASVGLYGVVALAQGQRRREIGVRIALGARPQQVVGMLFWSGLRLSITGLLLGLPLSLAAMTVAASELVLPDVNMAIVGATVALGVIAVASVATWLPARSAASVDPMIALRAE